MKPRKMWAAMSQSIEGPSGRAYCSQVSDAATCPPLTLEMVQDNIRWYEIEVLRKMPATYDERNKDRIDCHLRRYGPQTAI